MTWSTIPYDTKHDLCDAVNAQLKEEDILPVNEFLLLHQTRIRFEAEKRILKRQAKSMRRRAQQP